MDPKSISNLYTSKLPISFLWTTFTVSLFPISQPTHVTSVASYELFFSVFPISQPTHVTSESMTTLLAVQMLLLSLLLLFLRNFTF